MRQERRTVEGEQASDKVTIEDAIRLKHELNKNISYGRGGLNARELEEMENMSSEQYSDVRKSLSFVKKEWWFFPNYVWIATILLSCVGLYYFAGGESRQLSSPRLFIALASLRTGKG